jgi:hypothetical protein
LDGTNLAGAVTTGTGYVSGPVFTVELTPTPRYLSTTMLQRVPRARARSVRRAPRSRFVSRSRSTGRAGPSDDGREAEPPLAAPLTGARR